MNVEHVGNVVLRMVERPFIHGRARVAATVESPPPPSNAWWADEPLWYTDDTPPRRGNDLQPLIDGEVAMAAMWRAMANAKRSIWLAAWFLSEDQELVRGGDLDRDLSHVTEPPAHLDDLLGSLSREVDVRILLWPGSRVGTFRSSALQEAMHALRRKNPRIDVRTDRHTEFTHCQHQKALVVDGEIAFAGGMDFTHFDVDRWDKSTHPIRDGFGWHDAHCQIKGPLVADIARNFAQRWNETAPDSMLPVIIPSPPPAGDIDAQVVRTVPGNTYQFALQGIHGIRHAYVEALQRARRLVYLESQYLWSPIVVDALKELLKARGPDLRIGVVLPALPNFGKSDTDDSVDELLRAAPHKHSIQFFTLFTSGREANGAWRYNPIYVHAKVGVVDDEWLTIGSANLNGRGLVTDTELNIVTVHRPLARGTRLRLWSEHLALPLARLEALDPCAVLDTDWPSIAAQQARIMEHRSGALSAPIVPYQCGHGLGDVSLGAMERQLLDR